MNETLKQVDEIYECKAKTDKKLSEMIANLPNTAEVWYHLDYCLGDYRPAQQKQKVILDHLEKILFDRYDIDYHMLTKLIKHADERSEQEKKENLRKQEVEQDVEQILKDLDELNDKFDDE